MPLTREEYVEVCQICSNRATSFDKGIICKLTREQADYEEDQCPNFDLDPLAEKKQLAAKEQKKADNKNALIAGWLMSVGGIIWLLWGLSIGLLFFYSFVLIVAGVTLVIQQTIKNKKNKVKQVPFSDDILD